MTFLSLGHDNEKDIPQNTPTIVPGLQDQDRPFSLAVHCGVLLHVRTVAEDGRMLELCDLYLST